MGYLTALFAVFPRLFRPTRGVHTSPLGYFRELTAEYLRRRSRRVRRYVESNPFAAGASTFENPAPLVPAPRRPADKVPRTPVPAMAPHAPVADPTAVAGPATMVREFYLAHERRQEQRRPARPRPVITVLSELSAEVA